MSKKEYNIVSIGAGAAGLVTSYIGSAIKAKTALIEKHKMGGDCLNTGCVPSKALISSAKVAHSFKKADKFGIVDVSYRVDFPKVMDQIQEVIKKIEPHDSVERYTELGVDCIQGEATIVSPTEIKVNGEIITTKNIVIATGGRPFIPLIPGLDQIDYLHSDNLWGIREQPKKMLFLGGGPIGCELAQAFQRLGSEVTVIDMAPTILTREDDDVIKMVTDSFEADGLNIITSASIKKFEKEEITQKVIYEKDGKEHSLEFDKVFIGAGRKANTKGLGLEKLGIKLNPNGTVNVDPYMRTNLKNIYACGDVAGPYQFTHMAAHQAWYCAVNALFAPMKKFAVDYSVVPWATYTDPEVARVGLNEKDAIQQNIPYEVTTYPIDDLDRAIADRVDYGMVKVLTVPNKDKILGVTIVGFHAGDIMAEYVLAMTHGLGLNKILGTIHPYPTLVEANKYAAGEWKKAHKPEKVLGWLESFHGWGR